MKILKSSLETRSILNQSRKDFDSGSDNYCYVYLHKIDGNVFYVGMGSHDRAIRVAGRSLLWYKTAILEKVEVCIVQYSLKREVGEMIEQAQIQLYSDTAINYQYKRLREVPIVQLNRNGNLIRVFGSVDTAEDTGFHKECIDQCCRGLRGLHKNFVWMYKDDFDKKGFQAKIAANHAKWVEQSTKDGRVVRKLLTAQAFEVFGFNSKNIQQVCSGQKKSHSGFIFKYIDN